MVRANPSPGAGVPWPAPGTGCSECWSPGFGLRPISGVGVVMLGRTSADGGTGENVGWVTRRDYRALAVSDPRQPRFVLLQLTAHGLGVSRLEASGDRTGLALSHHAVVDRLDGHDLRGRAAHEGLVGEVEVSAHQRLET